MSTTGIPVIALSAAELGQRLRTARLRRGQKQAAVAMSLGVDVVTYSRWERGLHLPRPDHVPRLCSVLGMSESEFGFPEARPPMARSVSEVVGPSAAVEEEEDVRRREFLRGACGLLGATALMDWDRLVSVLSDGSGVDERSVDELLLVTRSYASRWGEVAPTTLLPLVQRQMALLHGYLLNGSKSAGISRKLLAVSSETATVGGWLSILVHNFGDARHYYGLARDLARDADDGPRLAFALGGASSLFSRISSGDDPPRALRLLQEAEDVAGASAPAHMRSWLHARLAEEHALSGDANRAADELEEATIALTCALPGKGEGIFVCCSPAWLEGFRGNCALLLGDHRAASTILEETLAADLALTSQRSAVMTDLGVAYALQGEVERACDLLGRGVEVAADARLAELVDRGARARREHLKGYEELAAVRDLDERLRLAAA